MTFSKFHLQDGQDSQRNQSFYGIQGLIGTSGNLQHFMDTVRFLTPGKEGKLSQIKAIKCFWRQEVKTLTEGTMYLL